MRIEPENRLSESTSAVIRSGLRRHTEAFVPWEEYEDLAQVARGDDGSVVAAAIGRTGRGWLHLAVIWVDESARRQGLGTQLLQAMETEAIRRGCHSAYLDTFS